MSNILIKNKMLSEIRQVYETYSTTTTQIKHNGLKGTFNEYGFVSLIRNLLPKNYSIGKGLIIDTKNSQSCEADIIIYENTDINPILFGPDSGLFPIETCRYVLEIKSTSNATEIQDSINKASILKKMTSINGQGPIFSYFAFSTDLTTSNEFSRFYKYESNISINSFIDTICVVNNGYWYKTVNQFNTSWQGIGSKGDFEEVLAFISGILNTLNRKTQIGYYLLEDILMPFVYLNFYKIPLEVTPEKVDVYNTFALLLEKDDFKNEIITLMKLADNDEQKQIFLKAFSNEDNNPLRKQAYLDYIHQL